MVDELLKLAYYFFALDWPWFEKAKPPTNQNHQKLQKTNLNKKNQNLIKPKTKPKNQPQTQTPKPKQTQTHTTRYPQTPWTSQKANNLLLKTQSVVEMNLSFCLYLVETRLFFTSVNLWWIFALKYIWCVWCPTKVICAFKLYGQLLD